MGPCCDCVADFVVELPCIHADYCLECTLSRFKHLGKTTEGKKPSVECPKCYHPIQISTLIEIATGSTYEDEFQCVFVTFPILKTIPGIAFCPRNGCLYAGWVDTRKTCWGPVECEKCGEKWIEQQTIPKWYRAYRWCRDVVTGEHEFFNAVWKEVWTYPCPHCGVSIEKPSAGHCYSLTCPVCSFQFCRHCHCPFDFTHRFCYFMYDHNAWSCVRDVAILLCALKAISLCYLLHAASGVLFVIALHIAMLASGGIAMYVYKQAKQRWGKDEVLTAVIRTAYGTLAALIGNSMIEEKLMVDATWALGTIAAHCALGLVYTRY